MLRIHAIGAGQMQALMRLMSDNENFDLPDAGPPLPTARPPDLRLIARGRGRPDGGASVGDRA